jgi:hypothetical protein
MTVWQRLANGRRSLATSGKDQLMSRRNVAAGAAERF